MVLRVFFVILMLLCAGMGRAAEDDPIQNYWSDFRLAVLNGDSEKVASMTRFPLWVRGPDDADPVTYYDRKSFPGILARLLDQQVLFLSCGKVYGKTMLQVIKDKKEIKASDYLTENVVSMEQFRFERIKGRWFFTRAYLEK